MADVNNASTENSAAEKIAALRAAFQDTVDITPSKFFFKKVKEKNDKGEDTGVETKRPTIEILVPRPSYQAVLKMLETPDSPECKLLFQSMFEVVDGRAREILNENESLTAENFDYSQLSWSAIANLPPAERRGGGISKETWDEFIKDYIAVMPGVTGKTVETISKSAVLFGQKYSTVKTVKKVLLKLKELLAIYAENTARGEEFSACIEFLMNKADTLLSKDEASMVDAL